MPTAFSSGLHYTRNDTEQLPPSSGSMVKLSTVQSSSSMSLLPPVP